MAGLSLPDDAAVWKLDEQRALVVTTDFFTPVVDDPYDYGQISAANSLSDIYAMGGEPFLALNILAIPPQLPTEIATEILRGGADKAKEAGVVIAGGHTIQDKEPKYGLVALGFVHPDRVFTKGGLKAADILFLSKPLGGGTITTGIKGDKITPEEAREAIEGMKQLNRDAVALALASGARGATDVTGFSLLGHAWEMAEASGVGLKFDFTQIPFYAHAKDLAKAWVFPGGGFDNAAYYGPHIQFDTGLTKEDQMLLFDPQTSGGLLFGVPPERADACQQEAQAWQVPFWRVGEVTASGSIEVVAS